MLKKLLSMALCAIMVMGMGTSASSSEILKEDSSEDYYNETVFLPAESISIPYSNEESGTPIGQVKQTVYVKETFDSSGTLINSRLMNENEARAYKAEVAERIASGEQLQKSPTGLRSFPADDSTSQGELTITLTVYDRGNNVYSGWGDAQWTNGVWLLPYGEERPSDGKDYLALTWGGNGQFKQSSKSISGSYQFDQGDISFSQAKADSYAGYCWQFNESKWDFLTRYYTDSIQSNVVIGKTYSAIKNKETAMRMTYIHTFDKLSGSIDFSVDTSGVAAAGVSLSTVRDQWQIQIDISSLIY